MNSTKKIIRIRKNKPSSIPESLSIILALHEKKLFSLVAGFIIIFGGIIITLHFLYSGYLPDFNFTSSVSLLAIIAITGLTIVLYLSLSLSGPLTIWQMFLDISEKNNTKLWQYPHKTSCLFAIPILFSFLLLIGIGWYFINGNAELSASVATLILFLSPVVSGALFYGIMYKLMKYPWLGWHVVSYVAILLVSNLLYIFTPVISYVFYFSRYATDNLKAKDQFQALFFIIIASVTCLSYNWLIFDKMIQDKVAKSLWFPKQMAFGLLLLTIILFIGQSWFSIPQVVLRMYSLADVENVTVVFDEKGCSVIKQFGIKYISDEKNAGCSINHATIVSDIGNDRLIESEEKKRFVIGKGNTNVAKPAPPNINTTIIQSVDSNGKIQNIRVEFKDVRSEMNGISVKIALFNSQGKLLQRELIEHNFTISPNSNPVLYSLPANLSAEEGIWCDIDIDKDGNSVGSKVTRVNIFN